MIVMIDMNMGNLQSVQQAFTLVGASLTISSDRDAIAQARVIILPGVGAFGDGMASLQEKGLVEVIRKHALVDAKPMIGICIGMQLLATQGSEHGTHAGLDIIPGSVGRLSPPNSSYRIPNMGWCDVTASRPSVLFPQAGTTSFYFAHSYYISCERPHDSIATLDYGSPLTVAIEHKNIFGVQFHPEKSQDAGLEVLDAFMKHVAE